MTSTLPSSQLTNPFPYSSHRPTMSARENAFDKLTHKSSASSSSSSLSFRGPVSPSSDFTSKTAVESDSLLSSSDLFLAYQEYLSSNLDAIPAYFQCILFPNMCLTRIEDVQYEFRPLPPSPSNLNTLFYLFLVSEKKIKPLDPGSIEVGSTLLLASKSKLNSNFEFVGFRDDGTFYTDVSPAMNCLFHVKNTNNQGFSLCLPSGAYVCAESRQFCISAKYFYDECTFYLKPISDFGKASEATLNGSSMIPLTKVSSTRLFPPLSADSEILPPKVAATDPNAYRLTRVPSTNMRVHDATSSNLSTTPNQGPLLGLQSKSSAFNMTPSPTPSMGLPLPPPPPPPSFPVLDTKRSFARAPNGYPIPPPNALPGSNPKEPLHFLSPVAILDSKKRFLVEPKLDHILTFEKLKIKKKYCPQILFFELFNLSSPYIPSPMDLFHLSPLDLNQKTTPTYVLLRTPSNMYLNVNVDRTLKLVSTPNECSIFLFEHLPHSPLAFALQSFPFNSYLGRKKKTLMALGSTLSQRESFMFHVPPLPQQALQAQNMRPPPKPPLAMTIAIVTGAIIGSGTGLTNFIMNLQKRAAVHDSFPPPTQATSSGSAPPPAQASAAFTSSTNDTTTTVIDEQGTSMNMDPTEWQAGESTFFPTQAAWWTSQGVDYPMESGAYLDYPVEVDSWVDPFVTSDGWTTMDGTGIENEGIMDWGVWELPF